MAGAPVVVRTVDYHTGGEPFRIVAEPPVPLPGATVAERRASALADPQVQHLRRLLCLEPRGHAGMYGCFVVPPDDDGAHLGVLFWHREGFSTACGHGTIALGAWAVDSGLVPAPDDGAADVVVDVPSGRVTARVHRSGGRTTGVDFVNVASRVVARDLPVQAPFGVERADLSWGGALYASVDLAGTGLRVVPEDLPDLVRLGTAVQDELGLTEHAHHPDDPRLSGVYGTVLFEDAGLDAQGRRVQRNVTVFADGEVDRSPCGSGTCARVVLMAEQGRLDGGALVHGSVVGSTFTADVVATSQGAHGPESVVRVHGTAHRTGEHAFTVDPDDDLLPGFLLL